MLSCYRDISDEQEMKMTKKSVCSFNKRIKVSINFFRVCIFDFF